MLCGMIAFLSFKVLDPGLNMSPGAVFPSDEKYVTMDITAATKGDQYFMSIYSPQKWIFDKSAFFNTSVILK